MRKFLTITGMALVLAATAASGQAYAAEGGSCGHAPRSQWMSKSAIKAKIASMGYEVRRLKAEGHCMEVYTIKHGARFQLQVNPVSGKIVSNQDRD